MRREPGLEMARDGYFQQAVSMSERSIRDRRGKKLIEIAVLGGICRR